MVSDLKFSGLVHTPEDVDAITENFEHGDGHVGCRDELGEALRDFNAYIFDHPACCGNLTDEGETYHPVWAHHGLLGQVFVFPYRHFQHILRSEQIARFGARDLCREAETSNADHKIDTA